MSIPNASASATTYRIELGPDQHEDFRIDFRDASGFYFFINMSVSADVRLMEFNETRYENFINGLGPGPLSVTYLGNTGDIWGGMWANHGYLEGPWYFVFFNRDVVDANLTFEGYLSYPNGQRIPYVAEATTSNMAVLVFIGIDAVLAAGLLVSPTLKKRTKRT